MTVPEQKVGKAARGIVVVAAATVMISRMLWPELRFDTVSLWLFILAGVALLIPDIGDLVSRIKRLKKGDIEVEFASRIEELAEQTEKVEQEIEQSPTGRYELATPSTDPQDSEALLPRDPRGALVALAVRLEARLSEIAEKHGIRREGRFLSTTRLVEELSRRELIHPSIPVLFRDFWTIRNLAVHSVHFPVTTDGIYRIIDLGLRIFKLLKLEPGQMDNHEPAPGQTTG